LVASPVLLTAVFFSLWSLLAYSVPRTCFNPSYLAAVFSPSRSCRPPLPPLPKGFLKVGGTSCNRGSPGSQMVGSYCVRDPWRRPFFCLSFIFVLINKTPFLVFSAMPWVILHRHFLSSLVGPPGMDSSAFFIPMITFFLSVRDLSSATPAMWASTVASLPT